MGENVWREVSRAQFGSLNDIFVTKYRSNHSGLTLVLAEVDTPIVDLCFCIRTHPHDDIGAAHAIEHLIFKGAKQIPQKGILDQLASLHYSDAPNASTHIDHTRFELSTANPDSLVELLSVFMEHIFDPLLDQNDFKTEVYNINQDGEENGVMFCELQQRDSDVDQMLQQHLLKMLYPQDCPYSKNASGDCRSVRHLDIGKVRQFHSEFYRPENTCLVISGKLPQDLILEGLSEIELKLFKKFVSIKKSQTNVTAFEVTRTSSVSCLGSEDSGVLAIGWRIPPEMSNIENLSAVNIIMDYLTCGGLTADTNISLEYSVIENESSAVLLFANGVKSEEDENNFPVQLREKLKDFADFHFLHSVVAIRSLLQQKIVQVKSQMEKQPQETIAENVIQNFLYDFDETQFKKRLDSLSEYERLIIVDNSFWMKLLRQFANSPWAIIIGGPDPNPVAIRSNSGPDPALIHSGQKSAAFIQSNPSVNPSRTKVNPISLMDGIKFEFRQLYRHQVTVFSGDFKSSDFDRIGLKPNFYQINSKFFHIIAAVDTSHLNEDERMFLVLITEVTKQILKDDSAANRFGDESRDPPVVFQASIGLGGDAYGPGIASQYICIHIQVEDDNYSDAIWWLKMSLIGSLMKSKQLQQVTEELLNQIEGLLSKPEFVIKSMHRNIIFQRNSNQASTEYSKQVNFLKSVLVRLQTGDQVNEIPVVISKLFRKINFNFHVWGDFQKLAPNEILDPWRELGTFLNLNSSNLPQSSIPVSMSYILDSSMIKDGDGVHRILGLEETNSSLLMRSSSIGIPMDDVHSFVAITILLKALSSVEGPLWQKLRGSGLVYGFSLNVRMNEGLMYLTIEQTSNVAKAYKEMVKALKKLLVKDRNSLVQYLDSARGSVIFNWINMEKSNFDTISQSAIWRLQNRDEHFKSLLIDHAVRMSYADILSQSHHVEKLISVDARSNFTSVVCPCNLVDSVKKKFERLGIALDSVPGKGNPHSNNLKSQKRHLFL